MNNNGNAFNAALVISLGSAISCVIATAVTGDAAGVANANCANKNSNAIIPVGAKPTIEAKLNIIGITKTTTIILLATLVKIAANANATTTNTIGGSCVNGINNAAIA